MAKKKKASVKKVSGIKGGEGPKIEPVDNALAINQIVNELKALKKRIMNLRDLQIDKEKRIDRLVDVLGKGNKNFKGI